MPEADWADSQTNQQPEGAIRSHSQGAQQRRGRSRSQDHAQKHRLEGHNNKNDGQQTSLNQYTHHGPNQ